MVTAVLMFPQLFYLGSESFKSMVSFTVKISRLYSFGMSSGGECPLEAQSPSLYKSSLKDVMKRYSKCIGNCPSVDLS